MKKVNSAKLDPMALRPCDRAAPPRDELVKLAPAKRHPAKRPGPIEPEVPSDLESDALRNGLERACKQINALSRDVERFEVTEQVRTREISALRSTVTRLKDEKRQLERRVGELFHDNEALRVADSHKARQIGSLVRSTNRQNNDLFWSVFHFVAGSSDFEAYAKSVDYNLTRLFTMLLAAEVREASDLSPEIKAHAEAISNIFDPFFYLTEYQDVALNGVNPLLHYVTEGCFEKRRPTLLFDPTYYAGQARLSTGDSLLHYAMKGVTAGFKPHPLFDTVFYFEHNPDVAKAGVNPLFHYQNWGGRERRDPSPLFNTEYYLELRNLGSVVGNPLHEYLSGITHESVDPHPLFLAAYFCDQAGLTDAAEAPLVIYEKRSDLNRSLKPHPLFDLDFMQKQLNIEFPEGISPLEAFCRMSRERDIDPSSLFESKLYRYQMEVERGERLNDPPIIDYLKHGYKDKTLLPNIVFDPMTYRGNSVEFSGPELSHYCLAGDRLGYVTHPLFNAKVYNAARSDDASRRSAIEHFQGSPAHARHVSHANAERPLPQDILDFVRRVYSDGQEFDPIFYRKIYSDLAHLSEGDARSHFEEVGRNEGRVASPRALVVRCNLRIRDLPLGFFPDEYVRLNPDLVDAGLKPEFLPAFGHYMAFGRNENRTIGKWQFHLDAIDLRIPTPASPVALDATAARADVCVLMHIFYPDLWPELAAFVRNFESVSRDVFVNIVDIAWTPHFQRELRELCPGAFVQLSNDNGRDIGGFTRLLDNVDINKYELFAFMHSKKSPHIAEEKADYWRRCLLRAFAGSPTIVAECVQMFKHDPTVGLIGAHEWRATDLGNNQSEYDRMLDRFEIEPQYRTVEYLSGTMFLIRSEVVQRIYDVLKDTDWEYGGDKDVEFHMDGQAAHAVERVVGNLVRQMGYRMVWR
jgi:hypothetical protein